MSSLPDRAPLSTPATPASGQQAEPAKPKPSRRPTRVFDHRQGRHGIVYAWLFKRFGRRLGPVGVALCCDLATYADPASGDCWPFQDTLAADIGVNRRSVIRALKRLIALGLVEKGRCVNARGKVIGNAYRLLTPPEVAAEQGSSETRQGCDFKSLDVCHKVTRRVTQSHTTCDTVSPGSKEQIQEQKKEVCVGADTHTPGVSSTEEIDRLTRLWLERLLPGTKRFKREQEEQFRDCAARLLAAGWSAADLESSIIDRKRSINEWPREWHKRLEQQGKPAASAAAERAERAARQARERSERAAAAADPEEQAKRQKVLEELRKKVGRKP